MGCLSRWREGGKSTYNLWSWGRWKHNRMGNPHAHWHADLYFSIHVLLLPVHAVALGRGVRAESGRFCPHGVLLRSRAAEKWECGRKARGELPVFEQDSRVDRRGDPRRVQRRRACDEVWSQRDLVKEANELTNLITFKFWFRLVLGCMDS